MNVCTKNDNLSASRMILIFDPIGHSDNFCFVDPMWEDKKKQY